VSYESVTTTNPNATYSITNAQSIPGITNISVTYAHGCTTRAYIINFTASEYYLVWSDEFDYDDAPDASKWHHQTYPPLETVGLTERNSTTHIGSQILV